jgi:hypothetical protein
MINPSRLLNTSDESRSYSRPKYTLVPVNNVTYRRVADLSEESNQQSSNSDNSKISEDIKSIKENVIKIEDILKKSIKINLKKIEITRKQGERDNRDKKESELEKKEKKEKKSNIKKYIPGLSLVDRLKQFLGNIIAGFLVLKLVKLIPKISEFVKFIKPVTTFISSFVGGMLDKFVTGIEIGYNLVDGVSNTVKNVFGEDAQKKLNGFLSAFNKFANIAIIAMMLASGGSNPLDGKFKGPQRRGFDRNGRRVNTRTQRRYRERYGDRRFRERFGQRNLDRLNRPPRPSATPPTGGAPGAVQSGAQRAVQRGVTRVAGRTAGRIAGRIPIVGPLIDFGIRTLIFKEPLGKAAAGAVGASVGQALGSWIGGAGATALAASSFGLGALAAPALVAGGAILGGLIGDTIGIALYDALIGSKSEKVQAKSGGGNTDKTKSDTKHKPKVQQYKPSRVTPGYDSGKLRLLLFYNGNMNAISSLLRASNSMKNVSRSLLTKVASLGLDLALGVKPSNENIRNLANSFVSIIDAFRFGSIDKFEGGGEVKKTILKNLEILSRSIQTEFSRDLNGIYSLMGFSGKQPLRGVTSNSPVRRMGNFLSNFLSGINNIFSPGSRLPAAAPLSGSDKFARISGTSGSVKYGGRENAPLTVSYSPFAKGANASLISGKGYRRSTRSDHQGYDIAAPSGEPLYAYLPGKVTRAGYDSSYGNYIEWKDSVYGQTHFYGHMLEPSPLRSGQEFKQGDSLGRVGSTGVSEGPHVHWEIGPQGSEIDPGNWVNTHPLKKPVVKPRSSQLDPKSVSSRASYEEPSTTTIALVEKKVVVPFPVG